MDILKIANLTKSYTDFTLDNISFNLPKGSIMGLIGENGAGKTTTIKLILNLIKRDKGSIKVFGLDNIQDEQEIKQRLGIVLDDSNFHDNLRPKDISNIMESIYENWDNKRFLEYIKRFKLPADKIVKDFSKGMRTKLSIATALSHNPQLLILDEPTSGLDPIVRNEILDIFMELIQDEEKSILFSTHVTSDLDKIADYITFIHNGKIVFSETNDFISTNYGIIKCGSDDFNRIDKEDIVGYRKGRFGNEVLINNRQSRKYENFTMDSANLEEIMLYYVRR